MAFDIIADDQTISYDQRTATTIHELKNLQKMKNIDPESLDNTCLLEKIMQLDDDAEISLQELLEAQEQPDVTPFSESDIIHLNALEVGEFVMIPIVGGLTKIKRIK